MLSRRGRNELPAVCPITAVNWRRRRAVVSLTRHVRRRRWKATSSSARNIGRRAIVPMARHIRRRYMVAVLALAGNRRRGPVTACGVEVDVPRGEWMGVFGVVGLARLERRAAVSIDFTEWSPSVAVLNRAARIAFRASSSVIIITKIAAVAVTAIKPRSVLATIPVAMSVSVEARHRRRWRDRNAVWSGVRAAVMIW